MMRRVGVVGAFDLAVHIVGAAAFYFDLDGGVVDLEFVVQFCDYGAEDLLA